MKKINSVAEALIRSFLAEMVAKEIISLEDSVFEIIKVEETEVCFLIHEKLKDFLQKQLSKRKPRFASASFKKCPVGGWLFTVRDAGAESFFFARQLQRILHRKTTNDSEKCRYIKFNELFLKIVMEKAVTMKTEGISLEELAPIIFFHQKTYFFCLAFASEGKPLALHDKSVDLLAIRISRDVPRWLNVLLETRNEIPGI